MFDDKEVALKFLRLLDTIVIPVEYTYFNHCTNFSLNPPKYSNCWTSMPYANFTIKGEMSFVERDQRIREGLRFGGVHKASITYKMVEGAKTFNIRVIMPKLNQSDEILESLGYDRQELQNIYMPRFDGRHPKLPNKTNIYMFASSRIDEVTGKKVDILYGIREEDIITYANKVVEELKKCSHYDEPIMPSSYMLREGFYSYDTDYEFNHRTYSLPRDKDMTRYMGFDVLGPDNSIQGKLYSQFEQELIDGVDINQRRR